MLFLIHVPLAAVTCPVRCPVSEDVLTLAGLWFYWWISCSLTLNLSSFLLQDIVYFESLITTESPQTAQASDINYLKKQMIND